MKTLFFVLFASVAYAQAPQVFIADNAVYLASNKITVKDGFSTLRKITPTKMWFYDQYVVVNNKKYYRPGFSFIRKNRAFLVDEGFKKVKI